MNNKMIEMAKLCCWFENRKCTANPGIDDVCDMSCEYGQACEALMSEGYRNCKDKVVLSKEEYEKLCHLAYFGYDDVKEQARNETAKEILKELYGQIDEKTPKWVETQVKMKAKQFGVEIKE